MIGFRRFRAVFSVHCKTFHKGVEFFLSSWDLMSYAGHLCFIAIVYRGRLRPYPDEVVVCFRVGSVFGAARDCSEQCADSKRQ